MVELLQAAEFALIAPVNESHNVIRHRAAERLDYLQDVQIAAGQREILLPFGAAIAGEAFLFGRIHVGSAGSNGGSGGGFHGGFRVLATHGNPPVIRRNRTLKLSNVGSILFRFLHPASLH